MEIPRQITMMATVPAASSVASIEMVWKLEGESFDALPENAGNFFELQAKEVFDLRAGDEDGDTVGEADDDGPRDKFDGGAHAGEAHDHEDDAGHHGADEQAIDAVRGDDSRDDDDESTGGATDLRISIRRVPRSESR